MNDTTPRRRPIVPGPSAPPAPAPTDGSISQRALQAHQPRDVVAADPIFPPTRARQTSPVGNLTKAISGVMREVGTIEKRGINKFHGYKYAMIEDVLNAITPLMGKHGITIFQDEVDIKTIENRVAVSYEFTVAHESGETRTIRHTAMSIARDSKGNFDDKALNKCHTAARKYVILSLFQVPSGDFDDGDASDNYGRRRDAVPGPSQETKQETKKEPVPPPPPQNLSVPHKISMAQGTTADQWAGAYLKAIEQAKTEDEIKQWDTLNDDFLQRLNDRYPDVYNMVDAGVQRRLSQITSPPARGQNSAEQTSAEKRDQISEAMPTDPQERMNWVAQRLSDMRTYEAGEAFWNQVVAPREREFDEVDWGLLLREWQRFESKFAPLQEDQQETP